MRDIEHPEHLAARLRTEHALQRLRGPRRRQSRRLHRPWLYGTSTSPVAILPLSVSYSASTSCFGLPLTVTFVSYFT